MVLQWMGADRVLYGSDAPPLTSLKPLQIERSVIPDILRLDKDKIFAGNAERSC